MSYYRNHFRIIDYYSGEGIGKIYESDFDGYGGNEKYTIIDKSVFGDELGYKIINELNEDKITDNENKHFTNDFKNQMLELVEEEITNEVTFDILDCLLEYIRKNISSKYKHKTVSEEYYKNHFEINNIDDGIIYGDDFNGIWENDWFTVIDIQLLGEELGLKIIDKLNEKDIKENGFKEEMLVYVEEEITNKLRNEICNTLLEYIGNNS